MRKNSHWRGRLQCFVRGRMGTAHALGMAPSLPALGLLPARGLGAVCPHTSARGPEGARPPVSRSPGAARPGKRPAPRGWLLRARPQLHGGMAP